MTASGPVTVPGQVLDRVRLREFTGRRWVLDKIGQWLDGGNRELLVTGAPGTGKTMLAARIVQTASTLHETAHASATPGWLRAAHFCQQHRTESVAPDRALATIAAQLAATVPGYAEAITRSSPATTVVIHQQVEHAVNASVTGIGSLVLGGRESARRVFDDLIRQPCRRLVERGTLSATAVILIDALDESVEGAADPTLAWLIARELRDDPVPGLRLLATTRPGVAADWFSGSDRIDLVADEPADSDDVGAYIARRLGGPTGSGDPALATEIAKSSGGNFLYAVHVVDDIVEHGPRARPGAVGMSLPGDLADVYRRFLDREIAADRNAWRRRFRPVLGALAQSHGDGLTRAHLIRVTGLDPSALDDTLRAVGPYLLSERPAGPFQVHHQSLRDYLRAEGEHHVYPAEATAAIVRALGWAWIAEEHEKLGRPDPYLPRHLLDHLADAMIHDPGDATGVASGALGSVVTDMAWVTESARILGAARLAADLSRIVGLVDRPSAFARDLAQALTRQAHNLLGHDAATPPGPLLQQVHYEAAACEHSEVAEAAAEELSRRGLPGWQITWSTGPRISPLLRHTIVTSRDARPLVVTADGRRGVVGRGAGGITVWDLATGVIEQRLTGHTRDVNSLFVSPDGTQIVSSSDDGTVRVWRPGEGDHRILVKDPFPIDGLAVTPDQRFVAVVRRFGVIAEVYETASGQEISRLTGHDAAITSISSTSDGRRLLTGAGDGTARIWDLGAGRCERVLGGHPWGHGVVALEMSGDGSRAVTADQSLAPRVRVWDLTANRVDHATGPAIQWGVSVTADGRWAVTDDPDGTTRLWDLAAGEPAHVLDGHAGKVHDLAVTADGRHAVTGSRDGTAKVWDLCSDRCIAVLPDGGTLWRVAVTPDGRLAVTASAEGTAKVWDIPPEDREPVTGYMPAVRQPGSDSLGRPAFERANRVETSIISPDGAFAVTGHPDGRAAVWDLPTGDARHVLTGHRDRIISAAVEPDGRRICTGSMDGTARLWDAGTGAPGHVLDHGPMPDLVMNRPIWKVAFVPDSRWIITAPAGGDLWIWDGSSGRPAHILDGASPHGDLPVITLDHRRVVSVSSSADHGVQISSWEIATGHRLHSVTLQPAAVHLTLLTGDGQRAITRTDQNRNKDQSIRVWDTGTGELRHALTAHDTTPDVQQIAASPDGQRLFACCGTDHFAPSTVHVWNLDTGALEHRLSGYDDWVDIMLPSPDSRWLTTITRSGKTFLWDVSTGERKAALVIDDRVSTIAGNLAHPEAALIGTPHGRIHYAVLSVGTTAARPARPQ